MGSSVADTFGKSMRLKSAIPPQHLRKYAIETTTPEQISWDNLPTVKGTILVNVLPDSIRELLAMVDKREPVEEKVLPGRGGGRGGSCMGHV